MNQNKGFTLVELIAVIIILSVISILSFASITKTIKNNQIKQIETFQTNLKTAAQIYVETNLSDFPDLSNAGGSINVTMTTLINKGYIDKKIDNPTTCSNENTFVYALKNEDNTIDYTVYCVGDKVDGPTYTTYNNGSIIYFNPVTGSKCTSAEAVSTTGTKTGCMKWYTFNDDGSSSSIINLILDHNTTALVAWNSSGSNATGPAEVLTQLKSDTSSWTGVQTRSDSYSVNNGTSTYTINYSTYKARLITASEVAKITGNNSFAEATTPYTGWFYLDSNNQTQTATATGASNYDWLFDYTKQCTSYGCNIADESNDGYWTSTSVASGTPAWCVSRYGVLDNYYVDNSYEGGANGVRPVITVSKATIK